MKDLMLPMLSEVHILIILIILRWAMARHAAKWVTCRDPSALTPDAHSWRPSEATTKLYHFCVQSYTAATPSMSTEHKLVAKRTLTGTKRRAVLGRWVLSIHLSTGDLQKHLLSELNCADSADSDSNMIRCWFVLIRSSSNFTMDRP